MTTITSSPHDTSRKAFDAAQLPGVLPLMAPELARIQAKANKPRTRAHYESLLAGLQREGADGHA